MKKTPLHDAHVALGAKMAPFAGWDMPLHYGSQIGEHKAVRESAGMFDVSHMGQFLVEGPGARDLLQRWMTNDVAKLSVGQACYGAICSDSGGVIDDLIVTWLGGERYLVVANASLIDVDFARLEEILTRFPGGEVFTSNESDDWAMIALQGPDAQVMLEKSGFADLAPGALDDLAYFNLRKLNDDGADVMISRTGYTGEDGFEILVPAAHGPALWERLLDAGAQPCGLGARDTLRLEAGYLLSGQDMGPDVDPLTAGIGWAAKLKTTPPPMGADALHEIRKKGPKLKTIGLRLVQRGIPRHGQPVMLIREGDDDAGAQVGEVTSGTFSPTLQTGVALARVDATAIEVAQESNARLAIDIRGRLLDVEIERPPFVKDTSLRRT